MQRRLRLRAGEAELAAIIMQSPGRWILSQQAEPRRHLGLVQPSHPTLVEREQGVRPIRRHDLEGTCAILSDMGQKPE